MPRRPGAHGPTAVTGRAVLPALLVALLALPLAGCGRLPGSGAAGPAPASGTGAPAAVPTPATPSTSPTATSGTPPAAAPVTPATPSAVATVPGSAADLSAGVTSTRFPQAGSGRLVVVGGDVPAPGPGTVVKVRVEVESGLPIDGDAFADFVLATLNDPRSWAHGGRRTFARTDGPAAVRVVLASPDTSARMCRPLQTFGKLSCRSGDAAVLTVYRWVKAIPEYGSDRTGYRHYVVNHEVGHALGHGHETCPGRGRRAPVMMQQTKGLLGCLPNPWPYP